MQGNFIVVAVPDLSEVKDVQAHDFMKASNCTAFSRDGKMMVSCGDDNKAKVYNTDTWECLFTLDHSAIARFAEFSPDGKSLLTSTYSTVFYLWNVQTKEIIHKFTESPMVVS